MTVIERIRAYPGQNIPRGNALVILGKKHPAYDAVNAMPCAGNHKIGYCTGVVVDKTAVLDAIAASDDGETTNG
jgi:hypothetical protein